MAIKKNHRLLFAVDGSPTADAALATALKFPWPASSQASAVVARSNSWLPAMSGQARASLEKILETATDPARRVLLKRWPDAKVVMADAPACLTLK